MEQVKEAIRIAHQVSAESLNRACACRTLNPEKLRRQLEAEPSLAGLFDEIAASRPHLFSSTAVFMSPQQLGQIKAVIAAVEKLAHLPAYRNLVLARAPAIAAAEHGPRSVFMGYDFHLGENGPQLIEINTNAGGALLNTALARAQQACCAEMEALYQATGDLSQAEWTFWSMFAEEWRLQRGSAPLSRIAIVDDAPTEQYLYPEFQLFVRLFERFGIEAVVADARTLEWRDGRLWHQDLPIDMVYNRVTDFYLQDASHDALRCAYEAGAVVVTPHPHAHALYADKRNLAMLTDAALLEQLGVDADTRAILQAGVPRTELVTPEHADDLWTRRRHLFFKPSHGFGSKAAYRGDKLTRRVWEEIVAGNYVAQALVPPSVRLISCEQGQVGLKLDVRAYVYKDNVQLVAARLYEGQTTNFRTSGGGFAPVFLAPL
ncbi:MAG TPA: hypothetical protein VFF81_09760 [Noviherbaspirillum sp.]|nr:hypothetical protein [Noviherbaspirillum sp.]